MALFYFNFRIFSKVHRLNDAQLIVMLKKSKIEGKNRKILKIKHWFRGIV